MHQWIEAADIRHPDQCLFPAFDRGDKPRGNPLEKRAALGIVKRRAIAANLDPAYVCNHTFRATGITTYMMYGGTLERAAAIAGHASTATTKLYDRRNRFELMDDIDRMRLETPPRPAADRLIP